MKNFIDLITFAWEDNLQPDGMSAYGIFMMIVHIPLCACIPAVELLST